jgi:hypothetical protein
VTAISPTSARTHEGIGAVRWLNCSDSTSNTMTTAQAVDWLDRGNVLWVADQSGPVEVRVVRGNPPYVRTVADNRYTDNLLALPRF